MVSYLQHFMAGARAESDFPRLIVVTCSWAAPPRGKTAPTGMTRSEGREELHEPVTAEGAYKTQESPSDAKSCALVMRGIVQSFGVVFPRSHFLLTRILSCIYKHKYYRDRKPASYQRECVA